jgi:hypothetical protein
LLERKALDPSLKMLTATIKARWVCEQARQQLKGEPGLDHFEDSMPAIRQAILVLFARAPPRRCPHSEKLLADDGESKLTSSA